MINMLTLLMACSLYQDTATVNAIIMLGSNNKPLAVTTISSDGNKQLRSDFKTPTAAADYAQQQIQQGSTVELGLMQLPSSWLPKFGNRIDRDDLFYSCKNIVVGTEILNRALEHCASLNDQKNSLRTCTLSVYKTGNPQDGQAYAQQVLDYAVAHPMVNNKLTQAMGDQTNLSVASKLDLPEPAFMNDWDD